MPVKNNQDQIKLGNKEEAREKLMKLLKRQKNTQEQNIQQQQRQIAEKLCKTQNYNITKIINEIDDQMSLTLDMTEDLNEYQTPTLTLMPSDDFSEM